MSTTTLHISLPDSLKRYVKERVTEEHYSNPSDYIRALIREDQKRQAEQRLERMLLEGLASEPGAALGSPEWDGLWKRVHARIQTKPRTEQE
jgi:antitoxin ParD1/3/4